MIFPIKKDEDDENESSYSPHTLFPANFRPAKKSLVTHASPLDAPLSYPEASSDSSFLGSTLGSGSNSSALLDVVDDLLGNLSSTDSAIPDDSGTDASAGDNSQSDCNATSDSLPGSSGDSGS